MAEAPSDEVALFALTVWNYKQGEMVSLMIHLGDRLGLYRAMSGSGPMTAAQLAERTGFHERWLLEWLRGQAAAGLLLSPDGHRFELGAAGSAVLAEEETSLWFAPGAFSGSAVPPDALDRLVQAFESGIGLSYDDLGPSGAHAIERMLAPWSRLALVPRVLPAISGLVDRLRSGARVADVGCGAGVAAIAVAKAFPEAKVEGWDVSRHAIERARSAQAEAGCENLEFKLAGASDLPDEPTYDLVLSLDCLHDMPKPADAAAAVRRALREDGVWLIKDIRSTGDWSADTKNPLLAMMYATSVATCLSSAMSEPDGAGLGTLGLPPQRLEQLCKGAGFATFEVHDLEDPANLYYEVRP